MAASESLDTPASERKSQDKAKQTGPSIGDALLDRGAILSARDDQGRSVLHHVFASRWKRSVLAAERFWKETPYLLLQEDQDGNTPFHLAARSGNIELIQKMISAGADLVSPDSEGNTALHQISRRIGDGSEKSRAALVQLLDLGLPVGAQNDKGETALHVMASNIPLDRKSTLFVEPYCADLETRLTTMVAMYTAAGADLHSRDHGGRTILHAVAARFVLSSDPQARMLLRGREKEHIAGQIVLLFKSLMKMGLDPMKEDNSQRTCIDVAAACGHDKILKLFEGEGRDSQAQVIKTLYLLGCVPREGLLLCHILSNGEYYA